MSRAALAAMLPSFVVGILLGLVVTWVIWPINFANADPADLRTSLKEEYVLMTSAAYESSGAVGPARKRIDSLGLDNPAQTFDALIAREKKSSQNSLSQDALIHLGQAIGLKLPYKAQRLPPSASKPIAVYVVATPVPTILTFRLVESVLQTCAQAPETARIAVTVRDSAGNDLPNMAIEIRGADLNETIYTGLKPERGVGYADYEASPGTFSVRILNAESETVSDLVIGAAPANCKADRGVTPRGWKLVFRQK